MDAPLGKPRASARAEDRMTDIEKFCTALQESLRAEAERVFRMDNDNDAAISEALRLVAEAVDAAVKVCLKA
ncbi:hypothetical protein CWO90_32570 [Bradyrhizobium sp. Leo121]|nr:hypothetical protein CWO90_32570 [Bradyrhizobium sp. Leo121]